MNDTIDFSKNVHLRVHETSAKTRGHKYEDFWSIVKINPTAHFNDPHKEMMLQMVAKKDGPAELEKALDNQVQETGLPVFKSA